MVACYATCLSRRITSVGYIIAATWYRYFDMITPRQIFQLLALAVWHFTSKCVSPASYCSPISDKEYFADFRPISRAIHTLLKLLRRIMILRCRLGAYASLRLRFMKYISHGFLFSMGPFNVFNGMPHFHVSMLSHFQGTRLIRFIFCAVDDSLLI